MNMKLCISTALYHESKLELSVKLKYFNLLSHIRAYKKIKTVVFDNRQQILQIMQIIFRIKYISVIHLLYNVRKD